MANIAFFTVKKWEQDYLKKALPRHTLTFFAEPLAKKHFSKLKNIDVLSLFVDSQLKAEDVALLPKLKLVALRSTGFDHVDIAACAKRDIAVSTVPFYGENTVAEHAFALLLCLSRKIHLTYDRTHPLKDMTTEGLTGFDLQGKTIGIVGGGHIGMHAIRMARGFGMKVLVSDPFPKNFTAELMNFEYVDLETLLKKADIISLHAPYNAHTHHLINAKNIKLVKKGCVFINTSRGGLIDTDVLHKALKDGTFSMAGIDVMEDELLLMHNERPHPHDTTERSKLRRNVEIAKMPNVIFTPHNAFNSQEALNRILATTAENIKNGLAKKYSNRVN